MCEYCNFEDNDGYHSNLDLEFETPVNGTKQHFEIEVEEDPDYDHYIRIEGTFTRIMVPIAYCPKCGRML